MAEFIDLIKEKIEAEYAKAEAMARLSEFSLNSLKDSPFEEACQSILRRASNEANMVYDFVEDIKTDIYEPLQKYFETLQKTQGQVTFDVEDQIKAYEKVEKTLGNKQTSYQDASIDQQKTMKMFSVQRMEQGKGDSYKSKVFQNMNVKMRLTEERARELKETVAAMNSFTANYKRKMKANFELMMGVEQQRHQQKIDALNKLLIF